MDFRPLLALLPALLASCSSPDTAAPAQPSTPAPVAATPTPPAPATVAASRPAIARPGVAVETDPNAPQPRASRCVGPGSYGNSGRGVEMVVMVSNDGGWCRRNMVLLYEQTQAGPYTAMDVIDAPAHGEVQIHNLNTETVFYYRAAPGYVGKDSFVLQGQPTYGRIMVDVTVGPARPRRVRPAAVSPPGAT